MRQCTRLLSIAFACFILLPSAAYAQAFIVGVVKDSSGAVLPGVTVEAASPALIEKTRSVVTDGGGQYRVENLRPGTYSVTFTLAGFNTVKREGIELTGTFTASVNAELRVGALTETIVVTGETPIVDVQSTTRQQVLDHELISTIPTSRNSSRMAALLPSVVTTDQDVGGLVGESGASAGGLTVHGNTDVRTEVNGASLHSSQGNGGTGAGNIAAFQEVVVDTSGISAEQTEGGVRVNLIPREGSNKFAGDIFTAFASTSMQSDNLTQDLKDRGLGTSNKLKKYYDFNPSFGGPIVRDRLWFQGTVRGNVARSYAPVFFNKNAGNPNSWIYEPDLARGSATNDSLWGSWNARVTTQATPKNKLALAIDWTDICDCPRGIVASMSPESGVGNYVTQTPELVTIGEWTAPLTNHLLLEAGFLDHRHGAASRPAVNPYFTTDPGPVKLNGVVDQALGLTYRAFVGTTGNTTGSIDLGHLTLSYITGAHAFKAGFNVGTTSRNRLNYSIDSPMSFRFNAGVPNQLTLNASPFLVSSKVGADDGLFVQDKWTKRRVTVTAGLRYAYFKDSFPETVIGPAQFVPTRNLTLPATDGASWQDLLPRAGVAIDVFGNGKTSLKLSANKYLAFLGLVNSGGTFTTDLAPASRLVNSTTRSWTDRNGNFVPDCNLLNPAAQTVTGGDICGAMSNPDFGGTRPGTVYDPATLSGWGKRDYNWQFSAGVQQEIMPRVSVEVGYFRTVFGNFIVTDNRSVSGADFDTFSITAPVDPRLPGGGGQTISGLYDLKPASFGRITDNFLTFSDNFGTQIKHFNGVDVSINARARSGLTLQGGTSTGRTTADNCDIVKQVPEATLTASSAIAANLPYCHVQGSFLTQGKFIATYLVPRIGVEVSGTLQNRPGPEIAATYTATNAVVSPSLGRSLSGGAANISVNIVTPGTLYGQRMNEIDLRIGKIVKFGRNRLNASVDLYNAMNSNPVLTQNNAFATWQVPQSILNPRFAKFVVQLDF
jgi:hypothetical protein